MLEFEKAYQAVCAWNRKKTWRTFWRLYKDGFSHFTVKDLIGWRVYRIFINTVSGRYKLFEAEFKRRVRHE